MPPVYSDKLNRNETIWRETSVQTSESSVIKIAVILLFFLFLSFLLNAWYSVYLPTLVSIVYSEFIKHFNALQIIIVWNKFQPKCCLQLGLAIKMLNSLAVLQNKWRKSRKTIMEDMEIGFNEI